jgi:Fis family transcriptional regulator, factor for inversion stimulation protein
MKMELEALIESMLAGGILFEEAVKEFEKQFILKVVNRHRNNLSKAATELRIHRNTLTKRLQDYEQKAAAQKARANGKRRQVAPRRKSRPQALAK